MKRTAALLVLFLVLSSLFSVPAPPAQASASLTNGYVTPVTGDVTTQFYYYVTFYDSSGLPPEVGCVVIDGSSTQIMSLWNGVPSNGVYRYSTTLAVGTHTYYFRFNLGGGGSTVYLGFPSSPFYGPTVNPLQRRLTVSGGDHDSPNPPNGNWYFNDGQTVWCSVTSPVTEGGTVWTCTGWTGTGSVPPSGSGSIVSFVITQDSSITWHWTSSAITHTLTVYSSHGSPVPSVGSHTYNDGDPVACSVTSPVVEDDITYVCTGWSGTGSVPASGTGTSTGTFIIHHSSTITWNWQALMPDFSVQVDPFQLNIERDSGDTVAVYVTSTNGFDGNILLNVADLPIGISPSFSKNPVHPPPDGQDSSMLTFSVAPSVPLGTYHPRVIGTSGAITHDFIVELEITGIDVTWEMINEQDNRVTPGDRVEYLITVNNYMQIAIDTVEVTLTSYSPTPIGIEVVYASQYTYYHIQDYEPISPSNSKTKSWQLQVWKTVDIAFYPGENVPRANILDPVPIGDFNVRVTVEWIDENGFHEISKNLPVTVQYPDFGPPPTGYDHYIQSSAYFHPSSSTVKYAASKAISFLGPAADTADDATRNIYWWVNEYFVLDTNLFACYIYLSRPVDTDILEKMKQGELCGQCFQSATVTVAILRALGIPARIICGHLIADFQPWVVRKPFEGHFWTEAYVNSKWIQIDALHLIHDTDEPFDSYVTSYSWCNSVKAAAMTVTDCSELGPLSDPTLLLSLYSSHWEDVSSKYNRPSLGKLGTLVWMEDMNHFLGLDVYDSSGRHVKADFEKNSTVIDIPGTYYVIQFNFSFIYVPFNITDFDVIVDARYADHPVEPYNLTSAVIVNSMVASEVSYQSTINASTTEGYHAQIANQTIEFTPGIHSVTITNITSSKTIVCQEFNTSINISLANLGDFAETINVTVYANETVIGELTNIALTNGNSTTLTFTWNTTGFAKGNYTISANATKVLGEVDTGDNSYADGTVRVNMVGDVAEEYGLVDIVDIVYVAIHFGSEQGKPPPPNTQPYEPNADINGDNIIDIADIVVIAIHFGETL